MMGEKGGPQQDTGWERVAGSEEKEGTILFYMVLADRIEVPFNPKPLTVARGIHDTNSRRKREGRKGKRRFAEEDKRV